MGMKQRKNIAVLLVLTLILTLLVGCGQKNKANGDGSDADGAFSGYAEADIFAEAAFSAETTGDFDKGTLTVTLSDGKNTRSLTTPTLNGIDIEDEAPTVAAFSGLMGYDGFCETHLASGTSYSVRLYYAVDATEDGTPLLIGAGYGYRAADDFVDVDGDGLFELVTTCLPDMTTSAEAVVYHLVDGEVWKAVADKSSILPDGASPVEVTNVISYGVSRYDGETSRFLFTYPDDKGEEVEVELSYPEQFNDELYQSNPETLVW